MNTLDIGLGVRRQEARRRAAKWDTRFLGLAQHVATWSKDPSTQVGAAIVDASHRVLALGYNGFPRGVPDDAGQLADRPTRLAMTVHAELNAILSAGHDLRGATLYVWPFMPCSSCAAAIIQAGIARVVSVPSRPCLEARWAASLAVTRTMFADAGVTLDIHNPIGEAANVRR